MTTSPVNEGAAKNLVLLELLSLIFDSRMRKMIILLFFELL